jgi:hypothetical protein
MEPRKSFLLRIDGKLWKELETWAQEEMRSVNGQIEFILKLAVQKRRGSTPPADDKRKST